ncbi:MAG: radical SAM protein [Proteobacteria bacterium]|nr:radical SAM protein [Desulfobacula sp.]MBU4133522.1 radical SAM protein [Pseudomonadota bacterium]
MQHKTVAFSKKSSNLFFHILTKCNLSCSHCYINREQHGDMTLPFDTIRDWLGLFAPKAPKTNLVLLGGEPTLHPDLYLVVREARRLGFRSITIDTNGYLFHNILDKITPDDLDFLSFSLDGATPDTNDKIRGKGSYDAVLSGIHRAKSKGFSCAMIYTVSDKNIHELARMPALVKGLGIDRFFIQVIGMRGESSTSSDTLQVSKDIWLGTIPTVAEKIAAQGIVVAYPKVFLSDGEPFQCAGNVSDNYFVFPNGRVYKCPICEDFPLHSHEIINNRLMALPPINETDLFKLTIPEGCVMNKMIQPGNLTYDTDGKPCHRIACCLLKQELTP